MMVDVKRFLLFVLIGGYMLHSVVPIPLKHENDELEVISDKQDIFEQFWTWRLKNTPEFATFVGEHKYDEYLDDMRLSAFSKRADDCKVFLKKVKKMRQETTDPTLSDNLELLDSQLSQFLSGQKYKSYLWPMNTREGDQLELPLILSWMKMDTSHDMARIVTRMMYFPLQIHDEMKLMKEGIRLNITMHEVSIKPLVKMLRDMAAKPPTQSCVFNPFRVKPANISEKIWNGWMNTIQYAIKNAILPTFRDLANFIEHDYLPHTRPHIGVSTLPNGNAFYAALLQYHTSLNLTATEIHALGLREVKRITQRMIKVKDEVKFTGTLGEFKHYLRTDPKFNYSSAEEIISNFKTKAKKIHELLPKYFSVIPKSSYNIVPMPASIAPFMTAAFYLAPSGDGKRPGTFFVNTYKPETRKRYEAVALSLHECEPGHHLQGALTIEHGSPLKFRRFMDDRKYYEPPASFPKYTSYVEGWALYSEFLGEEMGLYSSPYDMFGRLSMEMFRACRLVVDTGMHALGWSRERAIAYMKINTALSAHNIETEVNRYITWPGQATGYKIGELKIKELRERAETTLGDKFKLREFHNLIATMGFVPLDFMERKVDEFIKKYL